MTEILECAFLQWTTDQGWAARATWRCPICRRRNSKLVSGPGKMPESLPVEVVCNDGHTTEVVPYRWNAGSKTSK
jgi:hypothetical protein